MIGSRWTLAVALGACVTGSLAGQQPYVASSPQQVFRGGTDVVQLSVTVLDSAGHLVGGIDQREFGVLEDGVPQDITNFSREPQPIALSIVIDTSTSMERKLEIAQVAAMGFARRLNEHDVAQIIDFDSVPQILQTFSNDREALERAIRRTQAGGSTSLYNAIYMALDQLRRARSEGMPEIRRQAIVVLSDGEDTSSLVSYEDVLESSKRSEVVVYAVGLRAKDEPATKGWNEAEFVLRTLARETGGRAYFIDDVSQLSTIYTQIAEELANQYTIGYISKNLKRDGAWRRIVVKVARPNTTARTKSGYFAPRPVK